MKESLTRDQFRLYQLIWKRFAASRMQPAKFESTSVKLAQGAYQFSVSTSKVVFERIPHRLCGVRRRKDGEQSACEKDWIKILF